MSDSIYKEAAFKEASFYRLMTSAVFNAGSYISPTDEDIAEAGPEWKSDLPVIEVGEFIESENENDKYETECNGFLYNSDSDNPIPVAELEELTHLPKRRNKTAYDWWWA